MELGLQRWPCQLSLMKLGLQDWPHHVKFMEFGAVELAMPREADGAKATELATSTEQIRLFLRF